MCLWSTTAHKTRRCRIRLCRVSNFQLQNEFFFFVVVIIGFLMFTYCAQHEYNQIVKKRSNLFIEDKTKQKKKETSTLRCRRIIRNDSICSLAIDFPLTR